MQPNIKNQVPITVVGMALVVVIMATMVCIGYYGSYEHNAKYGTGSVVTTTAEYEYLTNDSFTGVVVRGETRDDPALTVRNRDGTERRIATEFLEPKR